MRTPAPAPRSTRFSTSAVLTGLLFFLLGAPHTAHAQQQAPEPLALSIGAAVGYVPTLKYGAERSSGAAFGVFGDLKHNNVIGQLDFTSILPGTVSNKAFDSGYGFFGSIGYDAEVSNRMHVPIMLSGGASIIAYSSYAIYSGQKTGSYKDVSPQFGFTVAPYYTLNRKTSLYGALRYLKGSKGSDSSEPIDLLGIAVGIRAWIL